MFRKAIRKPINRRLHNSQRRKFTQEEDDIIRKLVQIYGEKSWDFIAKSLENRSPRQCRDRWNHYLSPTISVREWTPEEDRLLIQLSAQYGTQWAPIAKFFSGRTDVSLKNRWNKLQRRAKNLCCLKNHRKHFKENQTYNKDPLTQTKENQSNNDINQPIVNNILQLPKPLNEPQNQIFQLPKLTSNSFNNHPDLINEPQNADNSPDSVSQTQNINKPNIQNEPTSSTKEFQNQTKSFPVAFYLPAELPFTSALPILVIPVPVPVNSQNQAQPFIQGNVVQGDALKDPLKLVGPKLLQNPQIPPLIL